jgi:DNA-binding HxlR family transcriptional regulator
MSGYGQFCPVAKASEILAERWTPLVLRELLCGSHRFSDLCRGVPLMSRSLLAKRLKELERAGVVERRRVPGREAAEYYLSPAGEELRPLIEGLGNWGMRWILFDLDERDLDPSLLMWDIRRGLRREAFPERRAVVRFDFDDVEGPRRRWWLLAGGEGREGQGADLCMTDPGFEVDLAVTVGLRNLTRYWLGQIDWRQLVASGLDMKGERWLQRSLRDWLGQSAFAAVERPQAGRGASAAPGTRQGRTERPNRPGS